MERPEDPVLLAGELNAMAEERGGEMKQIIALIVVLGGLAVALFAADRQFPPAPPRGSHEEFQADVVKVFSATDGNAVFRAYLVKWKGQEVIADDPLVQTDYRAGDTIWVLAMNSRYPNGEDRPALLHFTALAKRLPRKGSVPREGSR